MSEDRFMAEPRPYLLPITLVPRRNIIKPGTTITPLEATLSKVHEISYGCRGDNLEVTITIAVRAHNFVWYRSDRETNSFLCPTN
jgi:hypothetical protein